LEVGSFYQKPPLKMTIEAFYSSKNSRGTRKGVDKIIESGPVGHAYTRLEPPAWWFYLIKISYYIPTL